jgi:Holliday junction resolvase RusA-like endonuclease
MPITKLPTSTWFKIDFTMSTPLFNKGDKKVKRIDLDDRLKYGIDVFCRQLRLSDDSEMDDKYIKLIVAQKEDGEPSCTISVSCYL